MALHIRYIFSTTFCSQSSPQKYRKRSVSLPSMSMATKESSLFSQQHKFLSSSPNNNNNNNMDSHIKQMKQLEEVRRLLLDETEPLKCLALIDTLQRFAIDYHFQEEINLFLGLHHMSNNGQTSFKTLSEVSLEFRLMRQQGYFVSPVVFDQFKDESGQFKAQLSKDITGMIGLYEASHLGIEGEDALTRAGRFASKHLKACVMEMEPLQAREAKHTLEHPFRLTLPRYNAKFYLETSRGTQARIPILGELANLDFDIVQTMNQEELGEILQWWRDLGLAQELPFARDQPHKWFMWSLAMLPNYEFSKYRVVLTKPIAFVYLIDDIFDTYGTLEELVLFTHTINRWEEGIEKLPRYMKICFKALDETTNAIADIVLKDHGWNPIHILRKSWGELCNAFLEEAKWFALGHSPMADDYLRNGIISSGVPMVFVHLFALLGEGKGNEDILGNTPDLFSCPATILRLWDDLGSAEDENQDGHDGSYLECYMKKNSSIKVENAREHVMQMISEGWKKLNKACLSPNPFSPTLTTASLNLSRMVQVMYCYDDNQYQSLALQQHMDFLLGECNTTL